MYQKILNEAIDELKETDFKELFDHEAEETGEYVKDCLIETDLEVLLPDEYVTSVGERLLLYKELNTLSTEDELDAFRTRLKDRFGPLPKATEELVNTITLRRMAQAVGIEKLVLKQDHMVCHFITDHESPFFKSSDFSRIILFAQAHQSTVHLKETTERLTMVCDNVKSIAQAIKLISEIIDH